MYKKFYKENNLKVCMRVLLVSAIVITSPKLPVPAPLSDTSLYVYFACQVICLLVCTFWYVIICLIIFIMSNSTFDFSRMFVTSLA